MSKIRWISAQDLMDRWNLNCLELLKSIPKLKITAYDKDGNKLDQKNLINWKDGWGSIEKRVHKLFFLREEVDYYETQNPKINQKTASAREIKSRPCQRHRMDAINIAEARWKNDPSITIADMIHDNEINTIAIKNNGNLYAENTIRKWIYKSCPDPKPGIRPKKPKK